MSRVARPKDALTDDQRRRLLEIARESVGAAARGDPLPEIEVEDPALLERRGVFVTLTRGGALRGCLGEFEGRERLFQAVAERARASALSDPRFSPVSPDEVDDLHIEISVLRPLERVKNTEEIEVGRHGPVAREVVAETHRERRHRRVRSDIEGAARPVGADGDNPGRIVVDG